MSLVSVNGAGAIRAEASIPAWGIWYLDAELSSDPLAAVGDTIAGDLGGVPFSGTLAAAGDDGAGRYGVRVVGGRGGWGREVAAKAFRNDAGVGKLAALQDVARAAGETLVASGAYLTAKLGPHHTRRKASAFSELAHLAGTDWYVDFLGVTNTGRRPSAPYAGRGVIVDRMPAARRVRISAEEFTGLVPGAVVDGLTLGDVTIAVTPAGADVYADHDAPENRRIELYRAIFDYFDPRRRFRATYDARLISQSGARCDVQPLRSSSGLPALSGVPLRLPPGYGAQLIPGAVVALAFADGDPSRPYVAAGDYATSPAADFLTLDLGGPVALGAAYQGSTVQAGPFGGIVTLGSTRVKVAP